jgi:hypothetical protein
MSTTISIKPASAVPVAKTPPNQGKTKKKNKKAKQNQNTKTQIYISTPDKVLSLGIQESVNSFLFPALGIHRGQAKAFSQSALAYIGGSTILSNAAPLNNIFAFAFAPNLCNTTAWFQAGFGTSPAIALATVGPALITSVQAESYRVISFQATVIPQGSFTNQAGSGLTGFIPDNLGFVFTANNMANLQLVRPFKGVDSQIVHWLPTENSGSDETQFSSIANTISAGSAIFGYINIPTGSDLLTSFQIDYKMGIEYVPSPAYRPFVDKCSPYQDIRALQYVNQIVEKHWDPVMIGTLAAYEEVERRHVAVSGGHTKLTLVPTGNGYENTGGMTVDGVSLGGMNKTMVNGLLKNFVGDNDFQKGVVNAAIGAFNAVTPGDVFDIPYVT